MKNKKAELKVESLIKFRKLRMADQEVLFEIYSDQKAMKYRGSQPMKSIEDALIYVKNQEIREKEIFTIRKGIELISTEELIGSVMYRYDENRSGECEIGYSIGRQYWGQGFGKEIVKMMLKILDDNKKIENIIAWSNINNIASIKILEKNGFKRIEQDEDSSGNLLFRRQKKFI